MPFTTAARTLSRISRSTSGRASGQAFVGNSPSTLPSSWVRTPSATRSSRTASLRPPARSFHALIPQIRLTASWGLRLWDRSATSVRRPSATVWVVRTSRPALNSGSPSSVSRSVPSTVRSTIAAPATAALSLTLSMSGFPESSPRASRRSSTVSGRVMSTTLRADHLRIALMPGFLEPSAGGVDKSP